ncbi:FkbM family methyltransferase [Polluticaenibacter yanchengensis]|uniref:FkbM family methyltransferase n=1 Tax=Polluticaenibacter yanchengensis TaxID=3014562 RepID=A0ABT4UQ96_9BACT|nr:FkbM family methyltransferase [Chitinophagaceae bacterium LY-5]
MYKKISVYLNFFHLFGFLKGLNIILKLKSKNSNSIQLTNIKHPIHLRKGNSDKDVFGQVFLNQEYKFKYSNINYVIDAGANIGLFSIYIKNLFPDATIISIEPEEHNYTQLKINTEHYNHIYTENLGLWYKRAKLKVFDKYQLGSWGFVVEENNGDWNVEAISIPDLIQKYQLPYIDILKIDIEGSEKELFSTNYENWLPKVKLIIIELHDKMNTGATKTFFEAINKSFTDYSLSLKGENLFIENLGFKNQNQI